VLLAQEPLVYHVKEYGNSTDKVVFLFCPFSVPSWQLALPGLPIWHLTRAGYRVIAYSYSLKIATVSPQQSCVNIEAIIADADRRIKQLGIEVQVYCYGTSMGTVLAANVAARHARIKKVVLNLCSADIVEHIASLPSMLLIPPRHLKQYIAAGDGLAGLNRIFDSYSPINIIDQLAGKQVLLYLARNDRLHQYRHTKQLLQEFRAAGVELEYHESTHLGHYFAALKNHLNARQFMSFLAK
jgi:pimeloyl-ACP methyl ester carboxylesterase